MSADGPLSEETEPLRRVVAGAQTGDVDRSIARLDPQDMAALGLRSGDVVRIEAIHGPGATLARAMPRPPGRREAEKGAVSLDDVQRANVGAALGEPVGVSAAPAAPAAKLRLLLQAPPRGAAASMGGRVAAALVDTPCAAGETLRIRLTDGRSLLARVTETAPEGPVVITEATDVAVAAEAAPEAPLEGVAGLERQIALVREMVELPITRPDLFERVGVRPPRGVLFTGPPGSGKTLLARAVADSIDAAFLEINGPEIVSKHYGESEKKLRAVFAEAEKRAPAVIFFDEIDAIAQKRDGMAPDRQLERRVVAQLLTLMDGLRARDEVVVMAATNLPDTLDPALRRPGRFDREIAFDPPDAAARLQILKTHFGPTALADDVDLAAVADAAHGFVGADLAAVAREAGMAAIRALRGADGRYPDDLSDLKVRAEDVRAAMRDVGPSIVRGVAIERPNVRWSDVGGADEAKLALAEAAIWPLRHGEAFQRLGVRPAKGVLLQGPPGCGKTHLARALAGEAGVTFIAVRGAQLLSRYFGDSERAVAEMFRKARQAAPSILLFDELDALAPQRGGDPSASRIVAQLLTEIDGIEELRDVFLLGATNRAAAIDPALIRSGRFDLVLDIPPPDAATRAEILAIHLRGAPLGDEVDLEALAEDLVGAVGADLKTLADSAARTAIRRHVRAGAPAEAAADLRIERADFDTARAALRRSAEARRRDAAGGAPDNMETS